MIPTTTHRPSRLLAVVTLLAATLVGTGAVAAAADSTGPERSAVRNPDGSVTITVPAEKVERWCTETGPRRLERAEQVVERMRGDASTRGSAAWVRARADRAEEAGRTELAEQLRGRADRMGVTVDRVVERTARARERAEQLCTDGSGS